MNGHIKRLIVNADDFGWDDDTLETTIELIERGLVTSATIMTGRPASSRALDYAKRAGKFVSFGLHFNIVDGHLALNSTRNSLVDNQGCFWPSHRQRVAALFSRFNTADIAQELRAQLAVLQQAGVAISHVDSHGHLHKFPVVAHAMVAVLKEFGITKMRRAQDTYRLRSITDVIDAYCALRFPKTVMTTDHYYALDHVHEDWVDKLADVLRPGITEISVHPGRSEDWRRFECAPLQKRGQEDIRALGVTLMTYNDLWKA
jgi:predicted glycoside hydrolase/deacetylase ChbG (UPF0249 family)